MQHKHILFVTVVMLLLSASIVSGSEQVRITSPSAGPISISAYDSEQVKIYIETGPGNATRPYFHAENNLGEWTPSSQIDQYTYLAYWDIKNVPDGNYAISAKTTINGTEYFDMISVSVVWPDTSSSVATVEEEEEEEKELDVFGLDYRITVGQASDIFVEDEDTGDPVPDVQIKIKNKIDGTVLRTHTTDEYGRAYIIWDIVEDYTVGLSHPDYETTSETVHVVPVPETTTEESTATTESTEPEPVVQEVVRDPTDDEIKQYIEDTNALGGDEIYSESEIQALKTETINEYKKNNPASTTQEPVAASFESYLIPFAIFLVVLLIGAAVYNKYKDPTRIKSDAFGKAKAMFLKGTGDDFDPDAYDHTHVEDVPIPGNAFSEQTEPSMEETIEEAAPKPPQVDVPVASIDPIEPPERITILTPEEAMMNDAVLALTDELAALSPNQIDDVEDTIVKMVNVVSPVPPKDEFESLQAMATINKVLKNKLVWLKDDPTKKQHLQHHMQYIKQGAENFAAGGGEPAVANV